MYENNFTRANPGLIVILVDQSGSMSLEWTDGKSLAEQTAMVINRCIAEMGFRFTAGTTIKESANIVLIGYGGEPNYEAQLIRSGSIREYVEQPLRREIIKKKEYNREMGFYEIDFEIPINIEPVAGYVTPMGSALSLAESIIREWVNRTDNRDKTKDPVPLLINISDGAPTDEDGYVMEDFSPVVKIANNIKSIACPDGNPLVFNIHLSADCNTEEVQFPETKKQLPNDDELSGLLYDMSSSLPDSMVDSAKLCGFPNVKAGVKTFMSNVNKVEQFVQFLNFGTKGTGGNNQVIR